MSVPPEYYAPPPRPDTLVEPRYVPPQAASVSPVDVRVEMVDPAATHAPTPLPIEPNERPPCCVGVYQGRFGFWGPALWAECPCLCCATACSVGCIPCKDCFYHRGLTKRTVVGSLCYPFIMMGALFMSLMAFVCIDLWTTLAFVLTGCGCCFSKSRFKVYGDCVVWHADQGNLDRAEKRPDIQYYSANGTLDTANNIGTSSKRSNGNHVHHNHHHHHR